MRFLLFLFFLGGDNYCLLVPIQFTVSMHLLVFCINFMGLIGCYSNQSHPDARSLRANFLEANYLCKVTCRNVFKNDALKAQVMNLLWSFSVNAIQTTLLILFPIK